MFLVNFFCFYNKNYILGLLCIDMNLPSFSSEADKTINHVVNRLTALDSKPAEFLTKMKELPN